MRFVVLVAASVVAGALRLGIGGGGMSVDVVVALAGGVVFRIKGGGMRFALVLLPAE